MALNYVFLKSWNSLNKNQTPKRINQITTKEALCGFSEGGGGLADSVPSTALFQGKFCP